jgi:hypothetical protein
MNTRKTSLEHRDTLQAKYTRSHVPVVRGIVLVVALCSFIPFLEGFLKIGNWGVSLPVFIPASFAFGVASFALVLMTPKPEILSATSGKRIVTGLNSFDGLLVSYCVLIGLGLNWACAFLWFSRRCAFFSTPVIAATALIMASYAAMAVLVGLVARRNWRISLVVFVFVPGPLAIIALTFGPFQ